MFYVKQYKNGVVYVTDTTDGVVTRVTEAELSVHCVNTGDYIYGFSFNGKTGFVVKDKIQLGRYNLTVKSILDRLYRISNVNHIEGMLDELACALVQSKPCTIDYQGMGIILKKDTDSVDSWFVYKGSTKGNVTSYGAAKILADEYKIYRNNNLRVLG